MANPYEAFSPEYDRVRPGYPPQLESVIRSLCAGIERPRILEVGAGTGIFSQHLRTWLPECEITAVEPAKEMAKRLAERFFDIEIIQKPLEEAQFAPAQFDLVVCAQSFHWLDSSVVGPILARALTPGGVVLVINNQLRVELAWVHRLTRIMRSGDVHRISNPPSLGAEFREAKLRLFRWRQPLQLAQILALGRTRSAYLRSNRVNRARMQANLSWYLETVIGANGVNPLRLPYETHVWELHLRAD